VASGADCDDIAIKITIKPEDREEVLSPMVADPCLDPAGAVFVEPDADLLRFQLFVRAHEAQNLDHRAKRLQYSKSQLRWYLFYQSCGRVQNS